ncbi:MAG: endonuclease/exonuclease/phosphatase family protein [bacterium]
MRTNRLYGNRRPSHFMFIALLCAIGFMPFGCRLYKSDSLKVMSFNIRYDNPDDGENGWPNRREHVVGIIKKYAPAAVGVQEALLHQLNYLDSALADYAWVGVGRDDGKSKGEFTAIFYRKSRLTLATDSTFWLAPTPGLTVKGWDAALNRTVTWAKFEDSRTNRAFYLFNTHFDHRGQLARLESAKLLRKQIDRIAGNAYVIVTGDFNCSPDSAPYAVLTDTAQTELAAHLYNTKDISASAHRGPSATFNGFDLTHDDSAPIDLIFVGSGFRVLSHAHIADAYDGKVISDHFPVLVELLIL